MTNCEDISSVVIARAWSFLQVEEMAAVKACTSRWKAHGWKRQEMFLFFKCTRA